MVRKVKLSDLKKRSLKYLGDREVKLKKELKDAEKKLKTGTERVSLIASRKMDVIEKEIKKTRKAFVKIVY